jgi:transposase
MASERRTIAAICCALSLDREVVRRWCKRFVEKGFDGLKDRLRAGRPRQLTPTIWQKAATVIVQPPVKFGLPFSRWSMRELSRFLADRYGLRVSRSSLSRFLRAMSLKPHRIKYWLNPKDPDFDRKAAIVCKIYVAPPPEGDRALHRRETGHSSAIASLRDMRAGRIARVEFEYRSHGTRNLFARSTS